MKGNHCGIGFAYHTGTMINDNAFASNARDCLGQCNSNHQCKFWDYGGDGSKKYCRLRSSQGTGPIISEGFSYGSKHCILKRKEQKFDHKYEKRIEIYGRYASEDEFLN